MQLIADELKNVMASRLKLGERAKPVCRVEVDRMVFIPGRTENIQFVTQGGTSQETFSDTDITDESNAQTQTVENAITFPAKGYDLSIKTSNFGMRWGAMHKGVDLGIPVGTEVVAAWSGKVKNVSMKNAATGLGYYVEVQHDDGVWTRYGHLSKPLVKIGQQVNQGDTLALSGNTGHSTGPHLHFEIWINQEVVDPLPYLNGKQKMYRSSRTIGDGTVVNTEYAGQLGGTSFSESFSSPDWYRAPKYSSVDLVIKNNSVTQFEPFMGYTTRILFSGKTKTVTSFSFNLDMNTPGLFNAKFSGTEGDDVLVFRVYIGGKLKAVKTAFKGVSTFDAIKNIAFPAGKQVVRIEITYTGVRDATFCLQNITVYDLDGRPDVDGNMQDIDPTQVFGDPVPSQDLSDLIFGDGSETNRISLQVGQFSYMDTLTLDAVETLEIDDQFEMDSREAQIVISNPNGYYSPDYNPYYFPETYQNTPWSYSLNGFHYGVLSENTPIRVFLGYGYSLMRVFTGLIDKVDMSTDNSTITIGCRDMYKKILNKVLMEDKEYPQKNGHTTYKSELYQGSGGNVPRRQEIIAKAKKYAVQFGSQLDFKFLCAIAHHETAYGTTGAGREESGGFILGYGVYSSSNKDSQYAGIDRQLYYGAKRYKEAMKSKSWMIDSLSDVQYFWSGGDKGQYQWAADGGWPAAVWAIYSGYRTSPPADFATTPAWSGSGVATNEDPVASTEDDEAERWLKSSIVLDLAEHAGMLGWRQAPNDISYADYLIEESYLIELNQKTGKYIVADPDHEGEFLEKSINAVLTPAGWMNPYVDVQRSWPAFTAKVSDCINEVIKDTNYRVYCDRYGTFRLETIDYKKPVVATFTEYDNLISLSKTIDFSRGRSHVIVMDDTNTFEHFIDTDILMELKSEVRTTLLSVPYAKTYEAKKQIADRFFWDIKRLCRSLQISIPGNPALDVLDRVYISDHYTTTRSVYTIKGIRTTFGKDSGYMQVIDLMWGGEGAML